MTPQNAAAALLPAPRQAADAPPGITIGDIATRVSLVPPDTPAPEVDRLLRTEPELRGVVFREQDELRLLTRSRADDLMAGPFGYGRALLQRRKLRELVSHPTLILDADTPLTTAAREMLRRDDGTQHDDAVVTWADGQVGMARASVVFEQISELYQTMAMHDPLTELPNRLMVEQHARHLLDNERDTSDRRPAVLYIDLDHFKSVNDSLGHRAGDEVLVEFARRLHSAVRPGDLVARLGGDEFAVLLTDISPLEAGAIAERLVSLAHEPFQAQGTIVHIGASVGIAFAGDAHPTGPLSTLEALLRSADTAMYRAKEKGRGRVHRFGPGEDDQGPASRSHLAMRLAHAIAEGQMSVHYQPKLSLPDREIVEVEALARWADPELGQVSPVEFVPVAEAIGQIYALGRFVLRTACAQTQRWREAGHDLTVAVNLSPVQLLDPDLVSDVTAILLDTGLPPTRLRLEVTETTVVKDLATTVPVLRALQELGVRISLDDFGTGFSSLAMLHQLPLDELKIDRSFVRGLGANQSDAALVRLIVETAHMLGLTAIAEGIENIVQLDTVTRLGCDAAQGFLLGRPQPAEELIELIDPV